MNRISTNARRKRIYKTKRAFIGAARDAVIKLGVDVNSQRLEGVFFDFVAVRFAESVDDCDDHVFGSIGEFQLNRVGGRGVIDFQKRRAGRNSQFLRDAAGRDFFDDRAFAQRSTRVARDARRFVFLDLVFIFLNRLGCHRKRVKPN